MPQSQKPDATPSDPETRKQQEDPKWANSLKRLYDSVVDEPLPDNFKDLLSKLDDKKS